ncbi:MAG: hypothetical protein RLN72_16210 [Henriciella sp.]
MTRLDRHSAVALAALLSLSACTTASASEPARLESPDEASISRLKAVLAQAVGQEHIRLGAGDLSIDTSITVLPPPPGPLETHSVATPVPFDIIVVTGQCYVVRRSTGERYKLTGVDCVPAEPALMEAGGDDAADG